MSSSRTLTHAPPPASRPVRLLDPVRERIRYLHYCLRTEDAYVLWVRAFVRFHGLRHPREMGGEQVEAFLNHLVNRRNVSASTHKQALYALRFVYREALARDVPWMRQLQRPMVEELLGHSDLSTTTIYTHVLRIAAGTVVSPLDALAVRRAAP